MLGPQPFTLVSTSGSGTGTHRCYPAAEIRFVFVGRAKFEIPHRRKTSHFMRRKSAASDTALGYSSVIRSNVLTQNYRNLLTILNTILVVSFQSSGEPSRLAERGTPVWWHSPSVRIGTMWKTHGQYARGNCKALGQYAWWLGVITLLMSPCDGTNPLT